MTLIIGIAGISRSGKSRLAKNICHALPDKTVAIIEQDKFVLPIQNIPKYRDETDWESPLSLDFNAFKEDLIQKSKTHDIVIAEGLMAFYNKEIYYLFNKRIFIKISYETFLERKERDLRWGNIPKHYFDHIWGSYLKYGRIPHNDNEYMTINGEQNFELNKILNHILQ